MIIVIEGGDQAGKKTQTGLLAKGLRKINIKTKVFSFPDYSTPIGKEIAKYLQGKRKFSPQVIHCLLAANRWEKFDEILLEESKNSILIMNRYFQSNLVYGLANGLNKKWLENLDHGLPQPDLVILLDVSQKESFQRKKSNRDKFESNENFSIRISKIYKKIAKNNGWKIIDASKDKKEIHKEILKEISKKLRS